MTSTHTTIPLPLNTHLQTGTPHPHAPPSRPSKRRWVPVYTFNLYFSFYHLGEEGDSGKPHMLPWVLCTLPSCSTCPIIHIRSPEPSHNHELSRQTIPLSLAPVKHLMVPAALSCAWVVHIGRINNQQNMLYGLDVQCPPKSPS